METQQDKRKVALETLRNYGMKWAVLAALRVDMAKKGVQIPDEVNEELQLSHVKIGSGCFSPCEVGCTLSKLEAELISLGCNLGEDYMRDWFDLLGKAMQGQIDPKRLGEIPVLKPIVQDCTFLGCNCN